MSRIVLDMSMSLDGYIAGPGDDHAHGLGINGEVLHAWLREGGVDPRSHRPVDETNAAVFDDELEVHVVPVLLGQGRLLFDGLPPEHIDLELVRQLTPDVEDLTHRVTHLRYRVRRP